MLNQKLIREKRKRLKMTVDELSEQLGISRENLYKWEKGTKITDMDAYRKLENWLRGEMENVPHENGNTSSNAPVTDFKAFYGHDFSALVKAHLLLVESNSRLSIAHERLSRKVDITVRENEETRLAAAANIDALRDILKEQAVESGLFQSGRAFLEAYDKKVNEFVKKKKGVDIAPGSDKQSKKKA